MNFVDMSIERIPQDDMMRHIEKCGRVCYKSEAKITPDSAKDFVEMLKNNEHGSVLEHGTVYLRIPYDSDISNEKSLLKINKYSRNHWSRVVIGGINDNYAYITTNYRVIADNKWEDDLQYICEPTRFHKKRVTFKFVHDIGIARDSNRHRAHSISEESTRFINYNKRGATFTASPFTAETCEAFNHQRIPMVFENMWMGEHEDEIIDLDVWMFSCATSTYCYNKLINLGWKPQMARRALNIGVKTETYYTAFIDDWYEYIRKREKAAHPDLIKLVDKMKILLKEFEE